MPGTRAVGYGLRCAGLAEMQYRWAAWARELRTMPAKWLTFVDHLCPYCAGLPAGALRCSSAA